MTEEETNSDDFDASDNNLNIGQYAITKNYFQFEPIGPIDSDIDPVDEVENFIITTRAIILSDKVSAKNSIFKQILCFFATLAYNAVVDSGVEMNSVDIYLAMDLKYRDILDNLNMEEAYNEAFFSKWPDRVLPPEFYNWAEFLLQYFHHGS